MANMVEVLDSIMGSGKTTAILKWMKENCKERFIYISPLLSEIEERLVESVPELGFVTPSSELLTKSEDLINLLRDGRNIGTTHALFKMMTSEHIRLIEQWEYVVIVDEERATRQRMIVRQSSISNAIETLKVDKKAVGTDDVLQVAQVYFDWVMGNKTDSSPDMALDIGDMDDDIPM